VDVIARYLERLVLGEAAADPAAAVGLSLATLAENGYLRG
jgi:riboflavin synthase